MSDITKRVGKFALSRAFVESNPDVAMTIMGMCIIVRGETIYYSDMIEYVAISPFFELLDPGKLVPEYSVLQKEIDGNVTISFRKC
jgi:hypothetical protein